MINNTKGYMMLWVLLSILLFSMLAMRISQEIINKNIEVAAYLKYLKLQNASWLQLAQCENNLLNNGKESIFVMKNKIQDLAKFYQEMYLEKPIVSAHKDDMKDCYYFNFTETNVEKFLIDRGVDFDAVDNLYQSMPIKFIYVYAHVYDKQLASSRWLKSNYILCPANFCQSYPKFASWFGRQAWIDLSTQI